MDVVHENVEPLVVFVSLNVIRQLQTPMSIGMGYKRSKFFLFFSQVRGAYTCINERAIDNLRGARVNYCKT